MTALSFLLLYIVFAFLCACFYRYAHEAAGSPRLDEMEQAVAYNDMIFSFYGTWVAKRYNRWEQRRNAKLLASAKAEGISKEKFEASLLPIKGTIASQRGCELHEVSDDDVRMHIYSQRVEALRSERFKLNPYSTLGVCPLCSAYWFYAPIAAVGLHFAVDGMTWLPYLVGVCVFPSVAFTMHQIVERLVSKD